MADKDSASHLQESSCPPTEKPRNIRDFCSYIFMALIFCIPISTSAANSLAIIIILLWLVDGHFKDKFQEIRQNKVALAILAYIALHIIGILWTEDMAWGFYTIKKQWKLLLIPIAMNMAIRKHTMQYLNAFLWAMLLSVFFSYLIWFNIITPRAVAPINATWIDMIGTFSDIDTMITPYASPTPFSSHIVYTPLLAFTIYLLIWKLHINFHSHSKTSLVLTCSLIAALAYNLFLTSGRIGHLSFFALIILSYYQFFSKVSIKSIGMCFLLFPLIVGTIYFSIPSFKERINDTYKNIKNLSSSSVNSFGERVVFWEGSRGIIKDHPLIGVGTGDFPKEYKNRVTKLFPNSPFSKPDYVSENPHNQYLLVLTEFGIVGFCLLLTVFYHLIRLSLTPPKGAVHHLQLAFSIFFLVIFLGDSYLQTSTTSLLFSTFAGILFKNPPHPS